MTQPQQTDVFDTVDASAASTDTDSGAKQEQWFASAMADADKFKGRTLEVVWKRPDNNDNAK